MKELRKKIEEETLGLPEGIAKTDVGDLLVNKVGTKFVQVYNLHKQRHERYMLKDFAFFALGIGKVDILEEAIEDYLAWEKAQRRNNESIFI